ncbi:hypothetical protein [Acidithiobacillus ferriphilus]|uniref:hypothetical protein n=1 Tax=Acidithiobacillus ferriphilus TaxID=1689834 RepID=UPI001C06F014|nr:hypothetical protein [Acidithiobacillus ferriphilus]MBU2852927.1 hypothetical protein [Acidithiobacillus ferriphilus]
MHIEIVGANLPLTEVTRVVRRMAEELGWEAHWDGERFQVREGCTRQGCTLPRGECHEDGLDAVHADGGREGDGRHHRAPASPV